MGVGCGVGAADGFSDGAGDGAKVGAKLSVGGSVGLGERVGDGVQFLGRGDGLGVGRGVGSVGRVWGRGVGASVWAFVVASSSMTRSRLIMAHGRVAREMIRRTLPREAVRACGRFDRLGCPTKTGSCAPTGPPCALFLLRAPRGGSNVTAGRAGAAAAPQGAELRGLKNAQTRLVCAVL